MKEIDIGNKFMLTGDISNYLILNLNPCEPITDYWYREIHVLRATDAINGYIYA